ncbi:hypothetical protein BHE74_00043401 [Ensete ventricosum]|nr:hypothetical protein BHE74_00043401 [Ensete ventricosum]
MLPSLSSIAAPPATAFPISLPHSAVLVMTAATMRYRRRPLPLSGCSHCQQCLTPYLPTPSSISVVAFSNHDPRCSLTAEWSTISLELIFDSPAAPLLLPSSSTVTPSLFSLSHDSISDKDSGAPSLLSVDHRGSTLEVSVNYNRTLFVAMLPDCTINAMLVWHFDSDICQEKPSMRAYMFCSSCSSVALPGNCCIYAHGLFWTLRLSLRVQCREPHNTCWSIFTPVVAPKSSPSMSSRSHKARHTTPTVALLSIVDTSAESPRTSATPSTLLHAPSAISVLLHLPVFYFANVLCYLCSDRNRELSNAAFERPVFVPLSKGAGLKLKWENFNFS